MSLRQIGLSRIMSHADGSVCFCVLVSLQQGSLQIYLKSKNGPIEVYLCPEEGLEDASPVKSAATPKKEFPQPLCPPTTTPTVPPSCSVKEEPTECKLVSLEGHVQYNRILTLFVSWLMSHFVMTISCL